MSSQAPRPAKRLMPTPSTPPEGFTSHPLLSLSQVGPFEIIAPIGLGGMAAVYSARGPRSPERPELVALKVIHPHLATEPDFIDMFMDEAKIAARVDHPNVGRVYGAERIDDTVFIVAELVTGQSLREVLLRTRQARLEPSLSTWCLMASRVCRAAHAAHQAVDHRGRHLGLVHRDITPRNVLLSYGGQVKLIDFGVAWARHRITTTDTGWTKGKVGFVAPELIRGEKFDHRSDIFSLGVMLYTTLTGCSPFPGTTDVEKLRKTLGNEPVPPRSIRPALSSRLEAIIFRALKKSPAQRFATAAQMADALEDEAARLGDAANAEEHIADLVGHLFPSEREEARMNLENAICDTEQFDIGAASQRDDATMDLDDMDLTPFEMAGEDPCSPSRSLGKLGLMGAALASLSVAVGLAIFVHWHRNAASTEPEIRPAQAQSLFEPISVNKKPPALSKTQSVVISFDVSPKSARLELDGRALDSGTRQVKLAKQEVRSHNLTVRAAGFKTERLTFTANTNRELTIVLSRTTRARSKKASRDAPDIAPSPYR